MFSTTKKPLKSHSKMKSQSSNNTSQNRTVNLRMLVETSKKQCIEEMTNFIHKLSSKQLWFSKVERPTAITSTPTMGVSHCSGRLLEMMREIIFNETRPRCSRKWMTSLSLHNKRCWQTRGYCEICAGSASKATSQFAMMKSQELLVPRRQQHTHTENQPSLGSFERLIDLRDCLKHCQDSNNNGRNNKQQQQATTSIENNNPHHDRIEGLAGLDASWFDLSSSKHCRVSLWTASSHYLCGILGPHQECSGRQWFLCPNGVPRFLPGEFRFVDLLFF